MRSPLRLALLAGTVIAFGALAEADEGAVGPSPVLTETLSSGVYALQGSFDVGVRPHVAWQVLTDYDGIPHFVPSILTSVAVKQGAREQVVDQEFEGKALIFTRDMHVRLDVHEQPERRITFRDVALTDFEVYRGSWRIQKTPDGSRVVYLLWAKPKGFAPAGVTRGAFKDAALRMLGELRTEMVRRAAQPSPPQVAKEGEAP